jgi:hypothetical protein
MGEAKGETCEKKERVTSRQEACHAVCALWQTESGDLQAASGSIWPPMSWSAVRDRCGLKNCEAGGREARTNGVGRGKIREE